MFIAFIQPWILWAKLGASTELGNVLTVAFTSMALAGGAVRLWMSRDPRMAIAPLPQAPTDPKDGV